MGLEHAKLIIDKSHLRKSVHNYFLKNKLPALPYGHFETMVYSKSENDFDIALDVLLKDAA